MRRLGSFLLMVFLIASPLAAALPATPAHADNATQKIYDGAVTGAYCSQKYPPSSGPTLNSQGQDAVPPNASAHANCLTGYEAELNAKYAGDPKPTASTCSKLKGDTAACTSAIAAAKTVSKPTKAEAAAASAPVSAGPSTTSSSCGNTGCIDANAVGIPNVSVDNGLKDVITILSFAAGVLSVIFLVLGGIRYSTSDGTAQNVSQAKQTITFAIVGLVLSILAPLIVDFVIARGPQ